MERAREAWFERQQRRESGGVRACLEVVVVQVEGNNTGRNGGQAAKRLE